MQSFAYYGLYNNSQCSYPDYVVSGFRACFPFGAPTFNDQASLTGRTLCPS